MPLDEKEYRKMKRYYFSKVVGTGSEFDPYRAEVADKGVSHVAVIRDPPSAGDWCLVMVNTDDHTTLRGMPDTEQLPDFPLDGKMTAINATSRRGLEQSMGRRGIPLDRLSLADGYRDALNRIGRDVDPAFDVDKFDV